MLELFLSPLLWKVVVTLSTIYQIAAFGSVLYIIESLEVEGWWWGGGGGGECSA